jgi:hypothetical protein
VVIPVTRLPKAYDGVVRRSGRKRAAEQELYARAGIKPPSKNLTAAQAPRPNKALAAQFPQLGETDAYVPLLLSEIKRRHLECQRETFSPGSTAGWLDLTVWGSGGIAFIEVKGSKGVVSRAQFNRANTLRAAHQLSYIIWPEDFYVGVVGEIFDRLAGPYIPLLQPLPPLLLGNDPNAPQPVHDPSVRLADCGCPYGAKHNPRTCLTWNGGR